MFVLFQDCWFGKQRSKVCFGYIKFGRPLNVKQIVRYKGF